MRLLATYGLIWCWLCLGYAEILPAQDDVSFHNQIVPLLTRSGCNAGACHGAAAGRGGMHLSLFGSDAQEDYRTIVQQLEGRRLNRRDVSKSLFLRKPSGQLDHGGGQIFEEGGSEYQLIQHWIQQGCKLDDPSPGQTVLVEVKPIANGVDSIYQLSVQVNKRDVTSLAQITVTDPEAVDLDLRLAQVRLLRPGRHLVTVRYLSNVSALPLTRPYPAAAVHAESVSNNLIDRELNLALDELNLQAGLPIGDAAFLRRVTLGLTGRLPAPEETRAFLNGTAIDKRERLVDRLLASPAFVDYWTLTLSRWLRLHSLPNETAAAETYGKWIRDSVAEGADWRDMTQALLTATGDSHQVGPANFSRMVGDARAHAELVSELFLGARLGCANCHDHPLDRWTQEDYHGLAAMLSRIDRGRTVRLTSRGEVTNPKTSQPARWRLPGEKFIEEGPQPTQTLANWLTNPSQVKLSQSFTNRVWREMFGRGLVEAVDDMRETNPATHPRLLDDLSRQVGEHDYDLRGLLRWIVTSAAYARESTDRPDEFYGHFPARPLSPHVLADAIADVTGVPMRIDHMPAGMRAVQLLDPMAPAPGLDVLGRCKRVADCAASNPSSGLATQLHLINGELINEKLSAPDGRLMRMFAGQKSTAEIVEQFHLDAISQPLSAEQLQRWVERLDHSDPRERQERLQDWLWSLLSSRSFGVN